MPVINGTSGADTLNDPSGDDTINGLAGNDTINGGIGGTDVVNGGDGRDSLQFKTATSGVVVDFVAGVAGTTSFTNIEKVVTGDFNDRLTGNAYDLLVEGESYRQRLKPRVLQQPTRSRSAAAARAEA